LCFAENRLWGDQALNNQRVLSVKPKGKKIAEVDLGNKKVVTKNNAFAKPTHPQKKPRIAAIPADLASSAWSLPAATSSSSSSSLLPPPSSASSASSSSATDLALASAVDQEAAHFGVSTSSAATPTSDAGKGNPPLFSLFGVGSPGAGGAPVGGGGGDGGALGGAHGGGFDGGALGGVGGVGVGAVGGVGVGALVGDGGAPVGGGGGDGGVDGGALGGVGGVGVGGLPTGLLTVLDLAANKALALPLGKSASAVLIGAATTLPLSSAAKTTDLSAIRAELEAGGIRTQRAPQQPDQSRSKPAPAADRDRSQFPALLLRRCGDVLVWEVRTFADVVAALTPPGVRGVDVLLCFRSSHGADEGRCAAALAAQASFLASALTYAAALGGVPINATAVAEIGSSYSHDAATSRTVFAHIRSCVESMGDGVNPAQTTAVLFTDPSRISRSDNDLLTVTSTLGAALSRGVVIAAWTTNCALRAVRSAYNLDPNGPIPLDVMQRLASSLPDGLAAYGSRQVLAQRRFAQQLRGEPRPPLTLFLDSIGQALVRHAARAVRGSREKVQQRIVAMARTSQSPNVYQNKLTCLSQISVIHDILNLSRLGLGCDVLNTLFSARLGLSSVKEFNEWPVAQQLLSQLNEDAHMLIITVTPERFCRAPHLLEETWRHFIRDRVNIHDRMLDVLHLSVSVVLYNQLCKVAIERGVRFVDMFAPAGALTEDALDLYNCFIAHMYTSQTSLDQYGSIPLLNTPLLINENNISVLIDWLKSEAQLYRTALVGVGHVRDKHHIASDYNNPWAIIEAPFAHERVELPNLAVRLLDVTVHRLAINHSHLPAKQHRELCRHATGDCAVWRRATCAFRDPPDELTRVGLFSPLDRSLRLHKCDVCLGALRLPEPGRLAWPNDDSGSHRYVIKVTKVTAEDTFFKFSQLNQHFGDYLLPYAPSDAQLRTLSDRFDDWWHRDPSPKLIAANLSVDAAFYNDAPADYSVEKVFFSEQGWRFYSFAASKKNKQVIVSGGPSDLPRTPLRVFLVNWWILTHSHY
jgi:hypothetical protein